MSEGYTFYGRKKINNRKIKPTHNNFRSPLAGKYAPPRLNNGRGAPRILWPNKFQVSAENSVYNIF